MSRCRVSRRLERVDRARTPRANRGPHTTGAPHPPRARILVDTTTSTHSPNIATAASPASARVVASSFAMAHSLALGASNLANCPTNAPTPHATAIDAITDAHVHGRRVAVAIAVAVACVHRDIARGRARVAVSRARIK